MSFTEASCHAKFISSCSDFQWGLLSSSVNWAFLEPLEVTYSVVVAVAQAESQEIKHSDPQDLETSSPPFHWYVYYKYWCIQWWQSQASTSISYSFVFLRVIIDSDLLLMQPLNDSVMWSYYTAMKNHMNVVIVLFYNHAIFLLKKKNQL